jgi:hypothetical protein
MDVKRCRKKAEDRSVWAIVLKVALVKMLGPYANEEEEEEEGLEQEEEVPMEISPQSHKLL